MAEVLKYSLINGLSTVLYVIIIVLSINFIGNTLSDKPETVLIPIVMLLLFVISAAITGMLVLGRPLIWYLNGDKSEALRLAISTIGVIIMIAIIILIIMIMAG